MPVEQALQRAGKPAAVQEIVLTSIAGKPYYRLRQGDGRYLIVDAVTGAAAGPVDGARELLAASGFIPGKDPSSLGTVGEDRWTQSRALNDHPPFTRKRDE